jgi:hypothetical protein
VVTIRRTKPARLAISTPAALVVEEEIEKVSSRYRYFTRTRLTTWKIPSIAFPTHLGHDENGEERQADCDRRICGGSDVIEKGKARDLCYF